MYIYETPSKLEYEIDDNILVEVYSTKEFYINVDGECFLIPIDKLEKLKNIISDTLSMFENKE